MLTAVFLTLLTCALAAFPGEQDQVRSLPGLDFPIAYRHYSGYLDALNGSVLHYWFFESQSDPAGDPVVLWLNGGPGCSSVLGALSEQGPIHVAPDGSLKPNPYAWNLKTSVIFLESPAGVGFSYNLNNDYQTGDKQTALNNHAALASFYRKFPHLASNEFYIAGESYGGVYVPTLAVLVHDNKFPVNFKGFAIGNGELDLKMLRNSRLQFYYYHGLFDDTVWDRLVTNCCANVSNPRYCDFVNENQGVECTHDVAGIEQSYENGMLNTYNIYAKCDHSTNLGRRSGLTREQVDRQLMTGPTFQVGLKIPCMNNDFVSTWLNRNDVRHALHVSNLSGTWEECSNEVFATYKRGDSSMREQVKQLLDGGIKGLIYNGDLDAKCNFIGDKWFAESLGYRTTEEYHPWMIDNQIAGFSKTYENLVFTTIRGAGHMVPTDQPEAALKMFQQFIEST